MSFELSAPATVFCGRGPGGAKDLTGWLSGIFDGPLYTTSLVYIPSLKDRTVIEGGVKEFDRLIRSTDGLVIGLGHSQYAQVLSTWMREFVDDPTAPGERLQFVLTGNPLRPGTGALVGGFVVGGGLGKPTPTDTPWQVLDVAREHDGYAIKGVRNDLRQQWGKIWDHSRYHGVDLTTAALTMEQVGNTTLLTYP